MAILRQLSLALSSFLSFRPLALSTNRAVPKRDIRHNVARHPEGLLPATIGAHLLAEVEARLIAFERRYEQTATPFEWKFARADLAKLMQRLAAKGLGHHERTPESPSPDRRGGPTAAGR